MATLYPYPVTALAVNDSVGTGGNNTIASVTIAVYDLSDNVVTLYDDENSLNPEATKTTGADGKVIIWLEAGRYRVTFDGGSDSWFDVGVGLKEVATIAELRNVSADFDGQQFELLGHTDAGIGGGTFYYDAADTTSADDNGMVAVTTGGQRLKRKGFNYVLLSHFGYTGTDFNTYFNAARDYALANGYSLAMSGDHTATQSVEVKGVSIVFVDDTKITADAAGSFTTCIDEARDPFQISGTTMKCLMDFDDSGGTIFRGDLTLNGAALADLALMACPKKDSDAQNCANSIFDKITLQNAKAGVLTQSVSAAFTGSTINSCLTQSIDYDFYIRGNGIDDTFFNTLRFGANDRTGATGGCITFLDGSRGFSAGSIFLRAQNTNYDRYGIDADLGGAVSVNRLYVEGHFSQPIKLSNETLFEVQDFKVSLTTDCVADAEGDKSIILSNVTSGSVNIGVNNRFVGASNIDTFVKYRAVSAGAEYRRNCTIRASFDFNDKTLFKFGGGASSNDNVVVHSNGLELQHDYEDAVEKITTRLKSGNSSQSITLNASYDLTMPETINLKLTNNSGSNRNVVMQEPTTLQVGAGVQVIYVDAINAIIFKDGYAAGNLTLGYFKSKAGTDLTFTDTTKDFLKVIAVEDATGRYWAEV